ncbi:MAG: SAM-dependent methyltransferase [Pirellula sp.]
MTDPTNQLSQILVEACNKNQLVKAVLSVPRSASQEYFRVMVRPISVRGNALLQFTSETRTQQFHKNWTLDQAAIEIVRLATSEYRNLNLKTRTGDFVVQHSIKGKCFFKKLSSREPNAPIPGPVEPEQGHNRARNYLIPDDVPCPFLIRTGIMAKTGKVHAAHSRKFRQINRYLEFIRDIVHELPTHRPIRAIDFGCGKSYLTFAAHHLLHDVLGISVDMVGLDRRPDVVSVCNAIANDLGLTDVRFQEGEIDKFQTESGADLVISLHACDTATDDALFQAVLWKSRVVFAVPCCQHEFNMHLSSSSLEPLTSHGITKERFASLATDSMRASLMTAVGYRTQVLEFIDTEHTPKNLLIRCVRNESEDTVQSSSIALGKVRHLRETLGVGPLRLERRLADAGLIPCASSRLTIG